MAEPLKNGFNQVLVNKIGNEINSHFPKFNVAAFEKGVLNEDWEGKELKERMRHITICIHDHLNLKYTEAIDILLKVAPNFNGFEAMLFPDFVEVFGLKHEDKSLDAMEELTKYSSSEFAIRPFIIQNPEVVMKRMLDWSKHRNHHVRRLASEGCRPRLPWAMALPDFKQDPFQILPILENLKNDDSLYVRKSVANNINDITKDNPDIALTLAEKWYGKTANTNWIIKHGLRTLLKKGDERALDIFGFNDCLSAMVTNFKISANQLKIGDDMSFEFDISHQEKKSVFLKIGFEVTYVKSGTKTSKKIFHIGEKSFEKGKKLTFKKKLSFKDLSTRKHYRGKHEISILINGKPLANKSFLLG